ncbi:MAG: membrane protein insertase YidC [Candidatus Omnitrophica bacterium]|nr:membrane protein insertase YidC [Candidatus Omnitrophota bacterium]
MEKRLVLAIAVSLLILLTWSSFVSKSYHIENKGVTQDAPLLKAPVKQIPIEPSVSEAPSVSDSITYWGNEKIELAFSGPDASIKEVNFQDYSSGFLTLRRGFYLATPGLSFKSKHSSAQEIIFEHEDGDKKIIKSFYFNGSPYYLDLELTILNLASHSLTVDFPVVLGVLDFKGDQNNARFQDISISTDEKLLRPNVHKEAQFNFSNFIALRNRYFCLIVEPQEKDRITYFVKPDTAKESIIGFNFYDTVIPAGGQKDYKFHIYLGPQELSKINQVNPAWSVIINYGVFDFISQLLLKLLNAINNIVHNLGWSIIILSLIIYLMLFPLTLKQMSSMKKMQNLQPKIEELRKAYKDNPQKLNKEIMELYRHHKVNPLGGCLPMILQIPIFFALYQALLRSVSLKGAPFLWIKDLSEPDRLFTFSNSLPLLGNEFNLLPILMSIGMFIQQKFSMQATSSGSAEQQKMMLVLFPVMFGFIFYRMPSGLVLYWFVNSILMLIYQVRISRAK